MDQKNLNIRDTAVSKIYIAFERQKKLQVLSDLLAICH